jgi:hypothetical protein
MPHTSSPTARPSPPNTTADGPLLSALHASPALSVEASRGSFGGSDLWRSPMVTPMMSEPASSTRPPMPSPMDRMGPVEEGVTSEAEVGPGWGGGEVGGGGMVVTNACMMLMLPGNAAAHDIGDACGRRRKRRSRCRTWTSCRRSPRGPATLRRRWVPGVIACVCGA